MKKFIILAIFIFKGFLVYSQTDTLSTPASLKNMIVKETKEGGKYDFFTPIKGHEYDGVQIKPGLFDTKRGVALIRWGKVNYELGVKKLEDAYTIYSAYKGKEINAQEKEYIKIGYNRLL
jgi:hypothetical protein